MSKTKPIDVEAVVRPTDVPRVRRRATLEEAGEPPACLVGGREFASGRPLTAAEQEARAAALLAGKIGKALRDRILPNYGPTDPGDTLDEWRACVRVIVPAATNEQIDEAIRDAVRDGLMWWDGSTYRRAFAALSRQEAPNPLPAVVCWRGQEPCPYQCEGRASGRCVAKGAAPSPEPTPEEMIDGLVHTTDGRRILLQPQGRARAAKHRPAPGLREQVEALAAPPGMATAYRLGYGAALDAVLALLDAQEAPR